MEEQKAKTIDIRSWFQRVQNPEGGLRHWTQQDIIGLGVGNCCEVYVFCITSDQNPVYLRGQNSPVYPGDPASSFAPFTYRITRGSTEMCIALLAVDHQNGEKHAQIELTHIWSNVSSTCAAWCGLKVALERVFTAVRGCV